METVVEAVLLGFVEGLTEFLPVSSTGHLILLVDILGFRGPPGRVFEIVIQLGAILAVCWSYRKKLLAVVVGLRREPEARRFTLAVVCAFLPAMVLGVIFHSTIKILLFNPWTVSYALIIGGIAILIIERHVPQPTVSDVSAISWKRAVVIGLGQALAMFPGVSRSAATIMSGLLLGLDRKTAAEFSFFLAIPTMLAAASYDLVKNWATIGVEGVELIAIGFVSAFFTALVTVNVAIRFISQHGFAPFAWYRIALGVSMLILLLGR